MSPCYKQDGVILKITPRAKRVAEENSIPLEDLEILGTGFQGGISEKDILSYISAGGSKRVRMSALAAKIAKDKNLDISSISGSGVNGKIMKRDVEAVAMPKPEDKAIYSSPEAGGVTGKIAADGKEILEEVPYSGVRKIIGDRLSQSKFTAPHLYFTQKVNLEQLLNLRKQINDAQEKKTSVTDYIARAVIKALQIYPDMNASLTGDMIVKYKTVNLGIAVAAPSGLIVPVVKNAEKLSVVEISNVSAGLFDKARNGKLKPEEYSGGTFTISNLGMFGIENFTAIINPPEVGILAISATKDEPFVETDNAGNKQISIKPMMNITLSVDHRVIDGLLAAQFVTEVKKMLENPITLLI